MSRKVTGIVYKISSNQTTQIYIGKTIVKKGSASSNILRRLGEHRRHCRCFQSGKQNYVSSYELIRFTDHRITIIRTISGSDAELWQAESEEIKKQKGHCVNIRN